MNSRANSRGSTDLRGAHERFCFLPCLKIQRENGRGWSRASWRNGSWRTDCPCGWDCNCTSLFGIRRRRECEVKEVQEVKEVKKKSRVAIMVAIGKGK